MKADIWGKNILRIGILLVFALQLSGCGDANLFENLSDDSTPAAQKASAAAALNKQDYSTAITLLEKLCGTTNGQNASCDTETKVLLASAYMGSAGIDINLIKTISDTTLSKGSAFTTFSSIFTQLKVSSKTDLDLEQKISHAAFNKTNAQLEQELHAAVSLLLGIATRTPDQGLQLALAAAADLIVTLGVEATSGFKSNGCPNVVPSTTTIQLVVSTVVRDLDAIATGLTESGLLGQTQIDNINRIKNDIAGSKATSAITASDIETYLKGVC